MCSKRTIIATVLSVLFLIPLSAQERRGLPINNAPTAAFDLGWLAKYYGTDWSVILAKLQADAMNGRTPAGKSVKKSAGQTGIYDKDDYNLSLRTNLLHWAMLTRNIGVEWRISPGMGLMINGAYNSICPKPAWRYALWEVSPEFRWYMGSTRRWYLGIMGKAGQFNYKFNCPGKQGEIFGGGLSVGYQLFLSNALSMDFGLGFGYLLADYEEYDVIDGESIRTGTFTKNYIGPINAGISLVWKIF